MAKDPVISQMNADRPIDSLDYDLLGRGSFCISLANAIQQWNGKESLVVGVYGPWGSGKTSVKNIVLRLLGKKEKPLSVIEFNPWAWSGEDRLQSAFFDEIGDALSDVNAEGANSEELSKKWKRYATRMSLGGSAIGHLKTAAEFAAIPWAPMILGGISKALKQTGDAAGQAAEAHESENHEKNAEELKKELTGELAKLEKPVLIVIDDVDRLTTNEIRLLFRLVKANAAFPNLVFLLLFDRAVIEKSLDETSGSLGREYMEKIVQVGFDIPRSQQADVDKVLFAGLEEIIENLGSKANFEKDRWQSVFFDGIQPFLSTLRKVRRFLSSFSFHVGLFSTEEAMEVNFVDLVAIEALRTFEPELYQSLSKDREIVFGADGPKVILNSGTDDRLDRKAAIENWLNLSSKENKQAATEIARKLFPQIELILQGSGQGVGFEKGWLRTLRICHVEIFERYFTFNIPDGDVPQSFIKKLIDVSGDASQLKELILGLKEQEKIASTFQRLRIFANSIALANANPLFETLCEIAEGLPFQNRGMFEVQAHAHASRCLHEFLMQEEDVATRGKIALAALSGTSSLWLPVEFVSDEEPRDGRQLNPSDFVFGQAELDLAIACCLDKIRAAAEKNEILGRRLLTYLWRWKQWAGNNEASEWANGFITASPENALVFIEGMASTINSSAREPYLELQLRNLEPFVNVPTLREQLAPILQAPPDSAYQGIVAEKTEVIEAARVMFEQWDYANPIEVEAETENPAERSTASADDESSIPTDSEGHWQNIWEELNASCLTR